MAPQLLFDIAELDLNSVVMDVEKIESINPHRGAMRLVDGVAHISDDKVCYVAYKDVRDDEFWVPGHVPGRPIFPGVLMIEAAAQVSSIMCLERLRALGRPTGFMGFAGVDDVKFRGMVKPGDRMYLLVKEIDMRPRRSICDAQGLVDGNLVFEARIKGMPM